MANQPDFAIKEQNFGGVSHFYRDNPARVYVVEVTLASEVRGDTLQEAVARAHHGAQGIRYT